MQAVAFNERFPKPLTAAELKAKIEDLRLRCEQKSVKLKECDAELEAARKEALELRRCLKETGTKNTSVVPTELRAGLGTTSNHEVVELQRLLMWLAEQVAVEEAVGFNANHELIVADQRIEMSNVIQWCLDDGLRFSVPEELAQEISDLLSVVKTGGAAAASANARALAESWTLTQCHVTTGTVTLLVHRETQKTCIVADFPVPPPQSKRYLQAWAGISVGDHVEVKFKGAWYEGTVCFIEEGGLMYIHCDGDPPDVMTPVPFRQLPGTSSLPEEACKKTNNGKKESKKQTFSHASEAST
jgi:hypothetical protein